MTRLKYLDPADGQYKLLPVGGGSGGGPEEVTIAGTKPASPYTDLWVDTAAAAPVTDWSIADARYLTSGFRNVLRNGDFQIAQRGGGPWTSTSDMTLDNLYIARGGGTSSVSRVLPTASDPNYWWQTVLAGQSGANDYFQASMMTEDVRTLAGQTVTLSLIAKAATGSPKISFEIYQNFGTGGSPSSPARSNIGTFTLSTTAARYSSTFTVPSLSGKTIGTNNNHYIAITFWLSAGSALVSQGGTIGVQNNTFSISDVQLEAGTTATPFERLPVQQQLAWCQRYFWRFSSENGYSMFGNGHAFSTTGARILILLKTTMRAVPAFSSSAASTFRLVDGPAAFTITGLTIGASNIPSPNTIGIDVASSGLVSKMPYWMDANNNANAYLDLSAEL